MNLTPELKKQIDEMSLYDMLYKWRYAPIGDSIFQDESGEYYSTIMNKKKKDDPDCWCAASKRMG
jgi:hypothetical protein